MRRLGVRDYYFDNREPRGTDVETYAIQGMDYKMAATMALVLLWFRVVGREWSEKSMGTPLLKPI